LKRPEYIVACLLLAATASAVRSEDDVHEPPVSPSVAVLMQDRAGDRVTALALEEALGREIRLQGRELVDPGRARRTLRRLRLRDPDAASPEMLRRLGETLGVDWLVLGTLHDVVRRGTPRVAVSARVYSRQTGELLWAGFESGAGVDHRGAFGLGAKDRPEGLVPVVVKRLVADLEVDRTTAHGPTLARLGGMAIVPFESVADEGTPVAATVTEAARATMFRYGARLVSPGCTSEILRRCQEGFWGGVTGETRKELQNKCGADTILTGSVVSYETTGLAQEPEPQVAFDVRILDAGSGRITWVEVLERGGWDRQGPFRTRRFYARGALAEWMMGRFARRLLREAVPEGDGLEAR